MLGLEAGVQEVTVPDKGTMHRVRVGPFANPDEMNRARNQLSQNGIQATRGQGQRNPAIALTRRTFACADFENC